VSELSTGSPESLAKLFQALIPCVAVLGKSPNEFKELTNAIFGASSVVWPALTTVCDAAPLANELGEFLSQLVSANACYLLPSMQAIVRTMRQTDCLPFSSRENASSLVSGGTPCVRDAALYLYSSLKCVLRLVPSGISVLFRVLSEHFPPKRATSSEHQMYVRHLLRIADDLLPLRDRIIAIIVDKMIQIDVRGFPCRRQVFLFGISEWYGIG
jgi:hypothetical protein